MSQDFRAFLEAKYPLDSRSLNPKVLESLEGLLASKQRLRWLDLGTGSGAMIRRLIDRDFPAALEITALDIDAELLGDAARGLLEHLRLRGFRADGIDAGILAQKGDRSLRIRFERASILDWNPNGDAEAFDLITAHAVMDIVPLKPVIEKIRRLLGAGGMFYPTLNYDGETALIPVYSNAQFESGILERYDLSMDLRRVEGSPIGGSRTGRLLVGGLAEAGFDIHCYGTSDWNLTPLGGDYRDGDAICLRTLLGLMREEARQDPDLRGAALDAWFDDRIRAVDSKSLGMIVHQLDILAISPDRAERP